MVVMRSYLARGDRVAALNAYDECVRKFSEQLGIDPSVELRNLAAFLRRHARHLSLLFLPPYSLNSPPSSESGN